MENNRYINTSNFLIMFRKSLLLFLAIGISCLTTFGQEADILIKNGTLIDSKNGINEKMDVAIKEGKVYRVEKSIPVEIAKKVVDATGMYISPGLIDIHGHHFYGTAPNSYLSNGRSALPPDGFTFRSGVTTVVDVGGAGWKDFEQFKEQVIDGSKTRVLSFLNIVGSGMKGGKLEQNLEDMDGTKTAAKALEYKDLILGVKVAHFSGAEWKPVQEAVKAGNLANIPVMIDFGGHIPELSLEKLLMKELRPGDIFTHAFANVKGRTTLVDEESGKIPDYVFKAQKRGIIFDVGHGGGSFRFSQALPAIKNGFLPNTISTDLHTGSMNGAMKDQLNIMSKFLNMGVPLESIIEKSTWVPAQVIHRTDLGHLSVGAEADITILSVRKGQFGFFDVVGEKIQGTRKLECELTLRAGAVVYDLNGISY